MVLILACDKGGGERGVGKKQDRAHLAPGLVLVHKQLGGESASKAEELPLGLLLYVNDLPPPVVVLKDLPALQSLHKTWL